MRLLSIALVSMISTAALAQPYDGHPSPVSLAKQRTELAGKTFASTLARFEGGAASVEDVARWSLRWLDAASDGATGKALAAALAAHAARMLDLQDKAVAASKSGKTYASDADAATYFRVEADLWVARGRR